MRHKSITFWEVANSFGLKISTPINLVSTQYVDNSQDLNLVLDLIFFQTGLVEFNNYKILPDFQSLLDYISLSVFIIVEEKSI